MAVAMSLASLLAPYAMSAEQQDTAATEKKEEVFEVITVIRPNQFSWCLLLTVFWWMPKKKDDTSVIYYFYY